jgi:hypothetical protein
VADLDERQKVQELQNESRFSNNGFIGTEGFQEEIAAEVAPPISGYQRGTDTNENSETKAGSTGMGLTAIALSILSLFIFPVLLGITGIVLGFIARSRGARTGTWAIAIGAISLLLGIFVLPFF